MNDTLINTKQLAEKEGVRIESIRNALHRYKHFRGYKPVGFTGCRGLYLWQKDSAIKHKSSGI